MGNTRAQEAGDSQKNWLFDFFFKYFLITGELLVFYAGGAKQPCREGTVCSVRLLRAARWHGDIIWG